LYIRVERALGLDIPVNLLVLGEQVIEYEK
jgi:hypothetical protein